MDNETRIQPPFTLTILGSSSAIPTTERNTSAQLLSLKEKYYLIDCGEGTQIALRKYHIKFQRIDNIFVSHLHGDHYLGIIGLINTMNLYGRTNDLNVYCPPELEEIIQMHLDVAKTNLTFVINYRYLRGDKIEKILENKDIEVYSLPLKHRILTCGFHFIEKQTERNIKKSFIESENPTVDDILAIKRGADYKRSDGTILSNKDITCTPFPIRSFAYISDTAYCENLINRLFKTSLIYHEATFTEEHAYLAKEKFHSTAREAGLFAKLANADKLIIGHFSQRYDDFNVLLNEAKIEFPNTLLAEDGLNVAI